MHTTAENLKEILASTLNSLCWWIGHQTYWGVFAWTCGIYTTVLRACLPGLRKMVPTSTARWRFSEVEPRAAARTFDFVLKLRAQRRNIVTLRDGDMVFRWTTKSSNND